MNSARPLTGVLLFVLGLFLFACMDVTVKYLTERYPVPVVAALRYVVHGLLMVVLLAPSEGRRLVQTQRTGWVLVRAACLAGATLFMGLALQRMPVAETTAMVFMSPLLVMLVAGPLLGERVGLFEWGSVLLGFLGIILIARPGGATDAAGVLYALCAAGVMTGYQLLSRILAATEHTIAMLFHTALVGSLTFGLALPWFWDGRFPPLPHAGLFLLVGALGGLGHYLFTAAYRQAQASALAPLTYIQLLWALLLGWLVFDHVPDALSVIGMGMVTACGILAAIRSHRARPQASVPVDVEP